MTERALLKAPLKPNATIGIIGGGQLGRMLASSAARLGFRTIVLEPGADCPASQVCNRQIVAAYDDKAALDELEKTCDVVTYEFENVPLEAAHHLEALIPLSRLLRRLWKCRRTGCMKCSFYKMQASLLPLMRMSRMIRI